MKDRTPRRILVAIDFSPASHRALRYATDLAHQSGAILEVVHVVTPAIPLAAGPEPVAVAPSMVGDRRAVVAKLESWCAPGREEGIDSKIHVREGEPAAEILACVEELNADHLILGAHGRSALHELLLGSVAREIQKRARIPVTTLRDLDSGGN